MTAAFCGKATVKYFYNKLNHNSLTIKTDESYGI